MEREAADTILALAAGTLAEETFLEEPLDVGRWRKPPP